MLFHILSLGTNALFGVECLIPLIDAQGVKLRDKGELDSEDGRNK